MSTLKLMVTTLNLNFLSYHAIKQATESRFNHAVPVHGLTQRDR
ncbi:hypothetical protein IFM46972_03962 [Aspergillus udagawae]|uniref:Uncharacterized protein n=1 Tax=Aspergillus udagawae TaxID=91492 RepID=A0A8H3NL14_9EURO|nr:hypothetical protein IFM46972_03962 [Aspergillus udagawae]